jgi:acyl transferase domain-containing protein/acyl carrier protein
MNARDIEWALREYIAGLLHQAPEDVDPTYSLSMLGLDSVDYVDVAAFARGKFGVALKPEVLYELNSVREAAERIAGLMSAAGPGGPGAPAAGEPRLATPASAPAGAAAAYGDREIAIIGASVRLPGARSLDALWDLVARGQSMIRDFPAERAPAADPDAEPPAYLKGAFVEDVDAFDAPFFGISPREAVAMDPQQRLLLECAWHAFEDAGRSMERLSGSDTAVFIGASSFDYYELLLQTQAARTTHIGTGVSHAILANRVSQYFNLRGASEAIDTACSSSLVALARAVEVLRRGESELALVGGVNVLASRTPFQVFADAGMLSPEGACRPFDDAAAGYVRGEGAACVVLKRAAAAVRDGDRILAVIRGAAVRHSGRTNSLTAPSPRAQADVIVAAMKDAAVDPASIGYVEAHGTGTPLGDPVEVRGLREAFARLHGERGRVDVPPHFFIGSVKAQLGHLEAAAGMAGLLKVVAALSRRAVPGSPYLNQLNRHVDLDSAPFRLPLQVVPWEGAQGGVALPAGPRRAGVSSFGFGGVNSHVVLEEAPAAAAAARTAAPLQPRLFLLSARSAAALRALREELADDLASRAFPDLGAEANHLADLAFTLGHGRTPLTFRLAIVASRAAELVEKLRQPSREEWADDVRSGAARGDPPPEAETPGGPQLLDRLRDRATWGDLRALGERWISGVALDWTSVFPRGEASFIPLPAYPFARERFWPRPAGAASARPAFHQARWVPRPAGPPIPGTSSVLVLVAGGRGRKVAEAVGRALPRRPLTVAAWPPDEAQGLQEKLGPQSAVLDLSALDDGLPEDDGRVLRKLELLLQLVGGRLKKGEPLTLVQATAGLSRNLAGAQDSGIYKLAGAEYRSCQSKTVDFAEEGFDAEAAGAALALELEHHDGETEIAYQAGERLARVMEPVAVPEGAAQHEEGVALITGGTGDVGLRVAQDLVDRGFRALLLTGRRPLSPEKQEVVEALRRRGATITFYRGELDDARSLGQALSAFREAHGRITHVFHCAGTADRRAPALYQKTAQSMAAVLAPKVGALRVLHELFVHEPPRAFVLFSSASAVAPRLAAGVLDYAAANRFLDLFAQQQHALRRRYYRSVQWTRWQGLGLARSATIAPDGGGRPLAAEQCLEALHRILAAGESAGPVLCVMAEGDPSLAAVRTAPAPRPAAAAAAAPPPPPPPQLPAQAPAPDGVRAQLRAMVAQELEMAESRLDDEATFEQLGIDSIVLTGLVGRIEAWIGREVDPSELIRCNSIAAVARHLAGLMAAGAAAAPEAATGSGIAAGTEPAPPRESGPFRVAVIGMACRFPGAPDKETFWRNLASGQDSVAEVPRSRWDAGALHSSRPEPGKTNSRWGGLVEGLELISPSLFGLTAEEAADMDPLIRLFTECGLGAAVDSPYGREGLRGRRVGVFVGARMSRYAERIPVPGKHSVTCVGQNFISAYISHLLDLRGPSLVLDSACSSSLAAIHLACQSLRSGDSELALAGGVEVLLDEKPYLFLSAAHALSPDGRCRAFDEKANGFVPGEGAGCVLLKPLDQALKDGDPVWAVIDGSAMNNDGHTLGVTTPGVEGQVDVISRALKNAAVSPRDISYVEAHGTGTMIGDPIELRALARAFAHDPPARCAVGTVKSNVGHLLSAAGVASFIKVALALHHRLLPPTLHCQRVNPRFEFDRTPFFPLREAQAWEGGGTRRAGISSFGFGKTNVHLVLEERPESARRPADLRASVPAIPPESKVYAWRPVQPPPPAPLTAPPAPPTMAAPPAPAGPPLLALEEITFEEITGETPVR